MRRGRSAVKDCTLLAARHRTSEASPGRIDGAPTAFMTAVSPGTIGVFHPNQDYGRTKPTCTRSPRRCGPSTKRSSAPASSCRSTVQISRWAVTRGSSTWTMHEFLRCAEIHVEALNHALANIPADRMRIHVCWGNYEGPHTPRHPAGRRFFLVLLKAKPSALLIEGPIPATSTSGKVWHDVELPDDNVLVPGVIDTSTNYVEHPSSSLSASRATPMRRPRAGDRRHRLRHGNVCRLWRQCIPKLRGRSCGRCPAGAGLASNRLWKRCCHHCRVSVTLRLSLRSTLRGQWPINRTFRIVKHRVRQAK